MKDRVTKTLSNGCTISCGHPESGWRLTEMCLDGLDLLAGGNAMHGAAQDQLPTNSGWEFFANRTAWSPHNHSLTAEPPETNSAGDWVLRSVCPGQLAVELHVACPDKTAAVGLSLSIKNLGQEPLRLEAIDFAVISLSRHFCQDAVVINGDSGEEVTFTYTDPGGYPSSLAVHHPGSDSGLAMVSMAPGRTKKCLMSLGNHLIAGYQRREPAVAWQLPPGEAFQSDVCWLLPYRGSPRAAIRKLMAEVVRPRPVPQPITYCSWMPFMEDINEERLLEQIELAGALGFECFLIDGGWEKQRRFGERVIDPDRFPGGLGKLREAAEAQGMRLGLWTTLNAVHVDSTVAREHPEWAARDAQGDAMQTNVGFPAQKEFCILSPMANHWLEQLRSLIGEASLRYLKVDFPLIYDLYAPAPIVCHADGHDHQIPEEYSLRAYRMASMIAEKLRAEFPGLILDYTYELWGQWLSMDAALAVDADTCWMSNLEDDPAGGFDGPRAARLLAQSRSFTIPVAQQVCGNLRCDGPDGVRSFFSALASYPMLLGDLRELDQDRRKKIQVAFTWFKQLRDAHNINEIDCFADATGTQWGGYIRCSHDGHGLLCVFRDRAETATATLRFALEDYLDARNLLKATPFMGADKSVTASLSDFRQGIDFTLHEPKTYAIYTLRPAD